MCSPAGDLRLKIVENKQKIKNFIYIYIYIYIYISSYSAARTDFPDPLVIRLYNPSRPAGLLDYIQCSHRAVVDKL